MDDEERGFRQSLWQETSPVDFQCPPLAADQSCDVVIVGGGFTELRELVDDEVLSSASDEESAVIQNIPVEEDDVEFQASTSDITELDQIDKIALFT